MGRIDVWLSLVAEDNLGLLLIKKNDLSTLNKSNQRIYKQFLLITIDNM